MSEVKLSNIDVWLTTANQKNLLKKQVPLTASKAKSAPNAEVKFVININPENTFQQMDGFGASLTDASAWLINETLNVNSRAELMSKLFDKNDGISISFLRQPMGATDFTTKLYTYDDVPKGNMDPTLEHFTIEHDKEYIIPLLKEAVHIRPELKIMASPWSPPAWMKTSDNLIGGFLSPDYYQAYSKYFVKFIKAYEAEGLPIYAVTPQNEPMYVPGEYPGMKLEFSSESKFINEFLGPIFEENNIKTKIIAYDHNWDNITYPSMVLKDAGKYVAGSAWHCYGGTHDAMTKVHDLYPDKDIWFTEASGGEWVPPFDDAFADQMMHVIRATRNYAKTVVWWNIALDQNNGPTVLKHSTCRGLVKIDTNTKKITYNVDYYTMGHISKFVEPGAYRIESDNFYYQVETAAFKNPDGSIVVIAHNRLPEDKVILIKYGSSEFKYNLPGKGAVTFTWE